MRYKVGEFARLSGSTIKTLRFYDQIGLLKPASVDGRTGYRFYEPRQLRDLATITMLKSLGASLAEIQRTLARTDYSDEHRRLLISLRTRLLASLYSTQRSLQWLEMAIEGADPASASIAITLNHQSRIKIASIRASLRSYDEIDEIERELHRAIAPRPIHTLRGVLWHRCEASGSIEGEAFIAATGNTTRCGSFEIRELPATTVATAYCELDDHAATHTYEALSRWIKQRNYTLSGAKREIHLGRILQIQFPIQSA